MKIWKAVVVLLLSLCTYAYAETFSGVCGDKVTWELRNGALTISGTGEMEDYGFNSNRSPWYDYRDSIISVTINKGVTYVGACAFWDCYSLIAVKIPDGVTSVGSLAFSCCSSLTEAAIPGSVRSVGDSAFEGCSSLMTAAIPDGVTSVGEGLFSCCSNLTTVTIPDSVTSIGDWAFEDCSSLATVFYGGSKTERESITIGSDNAVLENAVWVYKRTNTCGDNVTWKLMNGELTISGTGKMTNWYEKTTVPWYEYVSGINSVTIKTGVTSAGAYAFCDCDNLTEVTLPHEVTSIGDCAFYGCSSLATVNYCGSDAERTNISVGDGNTALDNAEWVCKISGVCGVNTAWELRNGVLTISGTGEMEDYSDSGNRSPWYNYRDSITSVTINKGVTSVGSSAFSGCSSLTAIAIPDSVTSAGNRAFDDCSSLAVVYYSGNKTEREKITIGSGNTALENAEWVYRISGICGDNVTWELINGALTISGTGKMYDYGYVSNRSPWYNRRDTITSVTINKGVTSVGDCVFLDCCSVTVAAIPDGVTSVGSLAFSGCSSLTTVIIPDSVTSFGDAAFGDCSSLMTVTIPGGVTSVVDGTFSGCSSLMTVTIPDGVTSVGESAFSGCSRLTTITIPDSVTSVDDYAFNGCSSLVTVNYGGSAAAKANITIGTNNTEITDATWICNCGGIHHCANGVCRDCGQSFDISCPDTLILPENVKTIGVNALAGTAAQVIIVPDSCESIESGAFAGITGFISLPATVESKLSEGAIPVDAVVIYRIN